MHLCYLAQARALRNIPVLARTGKLWNVAFLICSTSLLSLYMDNAPSFLNRNTFDYKELTPFLLILLPLTSLRGKCTGNRLTSTCNHAKKTPNRCPKEPQGSPRETSRQTKVLLNITKIIKTSLQTEGWKLNRKKTDREHLQPSQSVVSCKRG